VKVSNKFFEVKVKLNCSCQPPAVSNKKNPLWIIFKWTFHNRATTFRKRSCKKTTINQRSCLLDHWL